MREHLQTLAGGRGPRAVQAREDLRGPPCPPELAYVWEWFVDLTRWRGSGGMGPAALTLHDITAWEQRFLPPGTTLDDGTLALVKRLDAAFLSDH